MSELRFRCQHRVTYAECTLGNHVYYARYLDMLELARGEFFRSLGEPLLRWQEQDTAFPVIECQLQYKHPARYDDVLEVELWLVELERIRLSFSCRVCRADGQLILEAVTRHVCATLAEKPKRLPPDLVALLRPYLSPPAPTHPTLVPGGHRC